MSTCSNPSNGVWILPWQDFLDLSAWQWSIHSQSKTSSIHADRTRSPIDSHQQQMCRIGCSYWFKRLPLWWSNMWFQGFSIQWRTLWRLLRGAVVRKLKTNKAIGSNMTTQYQLTRASMHWMWMRCLQQWLLPFE